jgi:hypothetical protein
MAGFRIEGNTSGNVAEVTSDGYLFVNTQLDETKAGYVAVTSVVDDGKFTGARIMNDLYVTDDFRTSAGIDTLILGEYFPGAALNTAIWSATVTTMTVTVASGFLTLNAGASVAASVSARVSSYRSVPVFNTCSTYVDMTVQFSSTPVANNICEWGLGIAATALSAPTDGAFFRLNAAGEFRAIVSFGGVELQSGALNFTTIAGGANATSRYNISITSDTVRFWVNYQLVATINRASGGAAMIASQNLPILIRNYNNASGTATAQIMKIGVVSAYFSEFNTSKPWAEQRAGAGDMGYQGPTGGTMGTTALYTNSLAAGAGAAGSNTAALGTGLGGQFSLIPSAAAGADSIISSYQVPVGTAAIPGKSLYIKGVKICGVVTTVLANATITALAWSLAFGHTTISLASAETPSSAGSAPIKAPRRIPIGIQTWAATAAVGVQADKDIQITFATPIVVQPGEFIQTVAKQLAATSATGVITFLVMFDAYWE